MALRCFKCQQLLFNDIQSGKRWLSNPVTAHGNMHNEKACRVNQVMWLQYRSPVEASMMSSHLAWTMKETRMRKGWNKDKNRKQILKQKTQTPNTLQAGHFQQMPVLLPVAGRHQAWRDLPTLDASKQSVKLQWSRSRCPSIQIYPASKSFQWPPCRQRNSGVGLDPCLTPTDTFGVIFAKWVAGCTTSTTND